MMTPQEILELENSEEFLATSPIICSIENKDYVLSVFYDLYLKAKEEDIVRLVCYAKKLKNKVSKKKSDIVEAITSCIEVRNKDKPLYEKYVLFLYFNKLECFHLDETELMHVIIDFMVDWEIEDCFSKTFYIAMKANYYDAEDAAKNNRDEIVVTKTRTVTCSEENHNEVYDLFYGLYLHVKETEEEKYSVGEISSIKCVATKLKPVK
jgi:hypothetical protein